MTRVNRIMMKGFKSFANKTEMLFGKDFNCILGPNGSGKSNVIDAVCFVLGKGSAKGLRVEKATNLIYNGGKAKNPAKDGEVSIYFDNTDQTFPTDEKEVKITRVVKQTGQSVYKINDNKRTRQQILELLSAARINPDGYNIILQGDIVEFVEMNPEKRRHIIEEVAGISVYEEKKQKALNELGKVEGKLSEAEIVLAERKSRLDELRTDRDQAMKYRDLETRQKQVKATLLSRQVESRKSSIERIERDSESTKEKIVESNVKIKEDIRGIKNMREDAASITHEIEEKGEKEQLAIQKEIEGLKVAIATHTTRIQTLESEIKKAADRKDQLIHSQKEMDCKTKGVRDRIKEIDSEISKTKAEREQLDQRISTFRGKHKLDESHLMETDIEKIDKEGDQLQSRIQTLREEQQSLFREKDRLEIQISSIDEKIERVAEIEKENKTELVNLKQKRDEFKKATLELNKLINENASLAAQLTNARQRLVDANDKFVRLKSKSGHLNEKVSINAAVDEIRAQKDKFKGVHDTIASLGKVSEKFSLALEVAAGPRIKSIVVDSDEGAARCIRHLKTRKIGIATFLPLNKIKGSEDIGRAPSGNGVHGLAVDLVSYDPQFKKVFSYVFGSTVVVDNIDVARRLGIGTMRMVTLDGDLVEKSGAMIGGFRQKQRRLGFSQKEVIRDLEKIEKEVDDLDMLVTRLEKEKRESEDRITDLREFKATLEGEIIKTEKSLHLDESDLDSSKKVKEDFRDELKVVEKKLNEIQTKVSTENRGLADLKIKKQKLRGDISQLRNPRLLAELNTFEEKRDDLKGHILSIEQEKKGLLSQIDTIMGPEQENIAKILKQHEKEEGEFKQEMTGLKENVKKHEADLKIKEKAQKEFYAKFKDLFARRTSLEKKIEEAEERVKGKEFKMRDLENRISTLSLEHARIEAELSAVNKEFEEYQDQELIKGMAEAELEKESSSIARQVLAMGAVNLRALEVYDHVEKEYTSLTEKKEKLLLEKEDVMMMMNEIEVKKKELFLVTFDKVNDQFKKIFGELSTKGEAFLELENPESPFDGGARISVRITGKKFLDIRSLSGGEKTLTALAFIFAIQEDDPASFYVLDEVDAALDKRNSEKLSHLVRKYSSRSQYIVISHNDGVISEADALYGVSMNEHGISKVVSLKI
ncbi:MAG: chromosome segregation protein SMC [archaeon]